MRSSPSSFSSSSVRIAHPFWVPPATLSNNELGPVRDCHAGEIGRISSRDWSCCCCRLLFEWKCKTGACFGARRFTFRVTLLRPSWLPPFSCHCCCYFLRFGVLKFHLISSALHLPSGLCPLRVELLLTLRPTWLFTTLVIYSLKERERNEERRREKETSLSTRIRTLDVLIGSSRADRSRSARTVSDLYAAVRTFFAWRYRQPPPPTPHTLSSGSGGWRGPPVIVITQRRKAILTSRPVKMPRLYRALDSVSYLFLLILFYFFSHCDVFNQDGKWESEEQQHSFSPQKMNAAPKRDSA